MISTIILVIVRNLEIYFFAEILIVDKTPLRKDLNFFQDSRLYKTIQAHMGPCRITKDHKVL